MKITVLGSGGWGTALSILLHDNGHAVTLWSYEAHETETLRTTHENPMLKGVVLPDGITPPASASGTESGTESADTASGTEADTSSATA